MSKVIVLDIEKCYKCKECKADCDYFYKKNRVGLYDIMEKAIRAAVCRHCTEPFCVKACANNAIERLENGEIKRHPMKCVGCNSCAYACFLGAIHENIVDPETVKCDGCLDKDTPICVTSCPEKALFVCEEKELPDNAYKVTDRFYVLVNYPIINKILEDE